MKRWEEKQIFLLEVEMFRVNVLVAVGVSQKDIIRWVKRHADEEHHAEAATLLANLDAKVAAGRMDGCMFPFGGGFIVFLKPHKSWVRMFGNMVHEMTHVTQYLLRDRRIPLTEETEEVHTYLVEYLVTAAARKML